MKHYKRSKMRFLSLFLALVVVACELGAVFIAQPAVVHAAEPAESIDGPEDRRSKESAADPTDPADNDTENPVKENKDDSEQTAGEDMNDAENPDGEQKDDSEQKDGMQEDDSEQKDGAQEDDTETEDGEKKEDVEIPNGEEQGDTGAADTLLPSEEALTESRTLDAEGQISLRFEGTGYRIQEAYDQTIDEYVKTLNPDQSFSFTIDPLRDGYKVKEVCIKEDDGDAVLTQGEDAYHYTISPADPEKGYTHDHVISVTLIATYRLKLAEYNADAVEEAIVTNGDSAAKIDLTAAEPIIQGFSDQGTNMYVKTVKSGDNSFVWESWVSLHCLNEDGSVRAETLYPVEDTASMSEQEQEYAQKGYTVFRLGNLYYAEQICTFNIGAWKRYRYTFTRGELPEDVHIIGYVRDEYGNYIGQEIRDEILVTPGSDFYFQLKWEGASSADYKWCDCYPVIVDTGNGASHSSFNSTTLEGVEGTVWQHRATGNTEIAFKVVPHTITLNYNADDITDMAVSSGNAKLSEDRKSLAVYGGENLVLTFKVTEGLELQEVSSETGNLGISNDYGGTYWASVDNMSALPDIQTITFTVFDTQGRISLSDPASHCTAMFQFEGKDRNSPFYTGEPLEARYIKVTVEETTEDGRKPRVVTLKQGLHYTVSYQNNKDAGEASLIVSAMPDTNYRGTVTFPFTIRKEQAPAAENMLQQIEFTDWGKDLQVSLADLFVFDGKYDKNVKPIQYCVAECDLGGTLNAEPVLEEGKLTYMVRNDAASSSAPARITLRVSFTNYEDAAVVLTIQPVKKDVLVLGGKVVAEDKVYDGRRILPDISGLQVISRDGVAISEQDAAVILGKIKSTLSCHYTGIDGTQYEADQPPVDIGSYKVQVRVSDENQEFKSEYLDAGTFKITERAVTITADDVALYQDDSIPARYGYQADGLAQGDALNAGSFITCGVQSTKETGEYPINVDAAAVRISNAEGRDVTANYRITGVPGTLHIREPEPGSYTVLYDLSGKGENVRRSGIVAGSLLTRPLDPVAEGYVFLGWYQDKTLSKEWNFDTDTVQEDMILYAGWSRQAEAEGLTLCVQEILPQIYTGKAIKPAVTVYAADGKTRLKLNKDYKVTYKNNTDADGRKFPDGEIPAGGTGADLGDTAQGFDSRLAYAVITGKGNYTGTVYVNFHIEQVDIGDGETLSSGIIMKCTDQFEEKAGKTATVVSKLKYKNLTLKYKTDYTLTVMKENTDGGENVPVNLTDQGQIPLNAGIYSLTVSGKGNYNGSVTGKLYIASKAQLFKNAKVKCKGTITNVTKQQLAAGVSAQDLTVSMNGQPLVQDTDYTVTCVNNHAIGTATVIVKGIGSYVGSKSCTFKIKGITFNKKALQPFVLRNMVYTGAALTQNDVQLKGIDGSELAYGVDYTIGYKNNIKKGKATMIFTARPASGYSGSFRETFKIDALDLAAEGILLEGVEKKESGYVLTEKVSYRKGGAKAADKITVRSGVSGVLLTEGRDYSVSYLNNAEVSDGAAQMILKGKGNYTGNVTVNFGITRASLAQLYQENEVTITPKETKLTYSYRRYREDPESDWEYELRDPEYEFQPQIVVRDGKKTLIKGVDYEVAYSGNVRSELVEGDGAAYAEIRGLRNYAGPDGDEDETITIPLSIYRNKISGSNIYVVYHEDTDFTYTGQPIRPEISVYYGKPADISKAKRNKITDEDILTEEKQEKDPDSEEPPEYAYGLVKLQEYQDGTGDYFLSYGANVAKGKNGRVIVRGTGSFAGSVTNTFTIVPREIYTRVQQPEDGH